jgi:hypothetical protein
MGISNCDNGINFKADKFGCDLGITLGAALRPPILDCDGTALHPAEFTQSRYKSSRPRFKDRSICAQKSNSGQLPMLLCKRAKRPGRCAAQSDDELAPSHPSLPKKALGYHGRRPCLAGDTTDPQNECDTLRMGTAGLGANKKEKCANVGLYLFSIPRSPLPHFGS